MSGWSTQAVQPAAWRVCLLPVRPGARRSRSACRDPAPTARAALATSMLAVGGFSFTTQPGSQPRAAAVLNLPSASPPWNSIATPRRRRARHWWREVDHAGTTRRWRGWARRWHGCAPYLCREALPQRTFVGPGEDSWRSNAKRRCRPGAMPQAICAASMAMVPEPQQGRARRAACFGRAAPAGGGEHRGGQRLLQRRIAGVFAPAALERFCPNCRRRSPRSAPTCSRMGRSGCRVSTLGRSPVASLAGRTPRP